MLDSTFHKHKHQAPAPSSHEVQAASPSSLPCSPSLLTLPRHVAFICDGNARWATARDLPAAVGHKSGANRCLELIETLQHNFTSVEYCTFFGFSTENWKRPQNEIYEILKVLEQTAYELLNKDLNQRREQFLSSTLTIAAPPPRPVQLKILGDLTDERLPWGLRQILSRLEQETSRSASASALFQHAAHLPPPLTVCLALNYGGRQDIVQASLKLAEALAQGKLQAKDVTEEVFASMLTTSDVPDPDLMIRTSGESRVSNFLLWDAAYSELYFTKTLWPDFDAHQLEVALNWYSQRSRRFGARTSMRSSALSTAA